MADQSGAGQNGAPSPYGSLSGSQDNAYCYGTNNACNMGGSGIQHSQGARYYGDGRNRNPNPRRGRFFNVGFNAGV